MSNEGTMRDRAVAKSYDAWRPQGSRCCAAPLLYTKTGRRRNIVVATLAVAMFHGFRRIMDQTYREPYVKGANTCHFWLNPPSSIKTASSRARANLKPK